MAKKKAKFYAVAIGKKPAIYESWDECEEQTKGFSGARFKSFTKKSDAEQFMKANSPKDAEERPAKRLRPSIYPRVKIVLYFDGGARSKTGASGSGAHLKIDTEQSDGTFNRKTVQVRKYLGTKATNNVAEYQGLLCGLEEAKKVASEFKRVSNEDGIRLKVIGDSDLVVQQMNGTYQCNSTNLRPLLQAAKSLVSEMEQMAALDISFEHVYRKDNSVADALANEAMDSRKSWTTVEEDVVGNKAIPSSRSDEQPDAPESVGDDEACNFADV